MRITITIPKPCHEEWQEMTPDAASPAGKGRHCAQCDHVVADLTQATDAQLVALFTSDAKPKCARFDPAQLDRVLGAPEAPRQAGALPVAAFTTLAAVASGCESIGQQPPLTTMGEPSAPLIEQPVAPTLQHPLLGDTVAVSVPVPPPVEMVAGQSMVVVSEGVVEPPCNKTERATKGEVDVDPVLQRFELGNVSFRLQPIGGESSFGDVGVAYIPDPADTVEICGTVVDNHSGAPIPFAHLWSDDLNTHTTTDASGAFRFRLPHASGQPPLRFEVRSPGYLFQEHAVDLSVPPAHPTTPKASTAPPTGAIDPHDPMGITGSITGHDGAQLPGLVVRVQGTPVRVQCDADGKFFLSVPEPLMGKPVTVEVLDADRVLRRFPLSAHAVPCCVPVVLTSAEMPNPPAKECHDVGTIRLHERPMLMGDISIREEPARPDTLERFLRPVKDALRKHPR